MKKRYPLLILLTITSMVFAQPKPKYSSSNVDVYMGPTQEREKGTTFNDLVATVDDGFIIYKRYKESYHFEYYNETLKRVKQGDIPAPKQKGVSRTVEGFIQMDKRVYMLFSVTDGKAETNSLLIQEISTETLKAKGTEREIYKIKGEQFYKNFANAFCQFSISRDGSKLAIAFKLAEDKDKTQNWMLMVLDSEMNLMWEAQQSMKHAEGKLRLNGENWFMAAGGNFFFRIPGSDTDDAFEVSNDGSMYFWAQLDRGKEVKDDDERFDNYFFKVNGSGKHMAEFGLPEKKKYRAFTFFLRENGELVVAGYYNNVDTDRKTRSFGIDGVYYLVYDIETASAKKVNYNEFDREFAMKFKPEKEQEKAKKDEEKGKDVGIRDLQLRVIGEGPDGSLILSGETHYYRVYYDSKGNARYTYFSQNIYVSYVDSEGKIVWNQVIPKNQITSGGPVGHGFTYLSSGNKLYYLYNDNFKNLAKGWDGSKVYAFKAGDNPVTLATIDLADPSVVSREQAWTTEQAAGMFRSRTYGMRVKSDTYMMYVQEGKLGQKIMRVVLK
jgi:hypothetical protein